MDMPKEKGLPDTTQAGPHSIEVTSNDDALILPSRGYEGNTIASAFDFLMDYHGKEATYYLVTFKKGAPAMGAHFTSGQRTQMQRWIEQRNLREGRDIYFHLTEPRKDFDGVKAEKEDIDGSNYVYADIDPPDDCADTDAFRRQAIEALRDAGSTYVIDSGRGAWGLWKLDERADLTTPQDLKIFEDQLKSLVNRFGGDRSAAEASRVGRLPYTKNHKTGRTATVAHYDPKARFDESLLPLEVVKLSDASSSPFDSVLPPREPPSIEEMAARIRLLNSTGYFKPYDNWYKAGAALKAAYGDDGEELWRLTHDETVTEADHDAKWRSFRDIHQPGDVTVGTLIKASNDAGYYESRRPAGPAIGDFYAYRPTHKYFCIATGDLWPKETIDSLFPRMPTPESPAPVKASVWLDKHRGADQLIWAPGEDQVLEGRVLRDGGYDDQPNYRALNQYKPPRVEPGNASDVGPWLSHIQDVYPDDWRHIVMWFAHCVQKPEEKVNHAIVLGGAQGIGKDTILEPLKYAVGPWNFAEVSPKQVTGNFNGWLKSVVLRISEARDLGDVDRYSFYETMKTYTAAPPDVLLVNEKFIRAQPVLNVVGVILTTNHKTNGLYLPADDRRHFVAWSERTKADFTPAYWGALWGWYRAGGIQNVCAYLRTLDISGFDPKANAPQTEAWHAIVGANTAPEDLELADAIDQIGNPPAITIEMITDHLEKNGGGLDRDDLCSWLTDRRHRRQIPHRMEQCGYLPVRNPDRADRQWLVDGARQNIYALKLLSLSDQIKAARAFAEGRAAAR